MKKYVAALAAVGALLGTAQAASANQSVRLINHAGLSGKQVAQFTNAARRLIDNRVGLYWSVPRLSWTSSYKSWTIEFYNHIGPVEAFCGQGVAGCHRIRYGKPYAVIDTNYADTGRIWSVAGTHELEEMWVDPWSNHMISMGDGSGRRWFAEIADPVEDYHHKLAGVQVSDFVTPFWYQGVQGRMQDNFGWVRYAGFDYWYFSCPHGEAYYKSWDGRVRRYAGRCNHDRINSTHGSLGVAAKSVHSGVITEAEAKG